MAPRLTFWYLPPSLSRSFLLWSIKLDFGYSFWSARLGEPLLCACNMISHWWSVGTWQIFGGMAMWGNYGNELGCDIEGMIPCDGYCLRNSGLVNKALFGYAVLATWGGIMHGLVYLTEPKHFLRNQSYYQASSAGRWNHLRLATLWTWLAGWSKSWVTIGWQISSPLFAKFLDCGDDRYRIPSIHLPDSNNQVAGPILHVVQLFNLHPDLHFHLYSGLYSYIPFMSKNVITCAGWYFI